MAKTKITPEEANDELNQLAIHGEGKVTFEEAFNIAEEADVTKMQDLNSEYFNFEGKEGQTFLFMITGLSNASFKNRVTEVVELVTKDKKRYINGDKLLVDAAKKLTVLPCFVKVTFVETARSPQGEYKVLRVYTFPSNIKK